MLGRTFAIAGVLSAREWLAIGRSDVEAEHEIQILGLFAIHTISMEQGQVEERMSIINHDLPNLPPLTPSQASPAEYP